MSCLGPLLKQSMLRGSMSSLFDSLIEEVEPEDHVTALTERDV